MSKQTSNTQPDNPVHKRLITRQQELINVHQRSATVDQLISDLEHAEQIEELNEEDEIMLALVVSEVFNGVDIIHTYPDFCRRLGVNAQLHEAFLDALMILEASRADLLEPLPVSTPSKLDFLQKQPRLSTPRIVQATREQWEVFWERPISFLHTLFFEPLPQTAVSTRRTNNYPDSLQINLISSEVNVNDTKIKVVLQAVRPFAQPDNLQLSLWAFIADLDAAATTKLALSAHLQWGSYDEQVNIPSSGKAEFPPFPVAQILDDTQREVTAELQLVLKNVT